MFGFNRVLQRPHLHNSQELINRIERITEESLIARLHDRFGYRLAANVIEYYKQLGKTITEENYPVAEMLAKQYERIYGK